MQRLEPRDLTEPLLAPIAACTNLAPAVFAATFHHVVEREREEQTA
jgi:hypothetical protein